MSQPEIHLAGENSSQTTHYNQSELNALLRKEFRPKTDQARLAVENAVKTLAHQALENSLTLSSDTFSTIQVLIAAIDNKLSQQINEILHHADFQALEGAWRGLLYLVSNTEYASWSSLRESEDARYIGLVMPRFLARLPYGISTNPVERFDFEEKTAGATHSNYVWSNAAYAMAVNINRSFKEYGWCASIRGVESGGAVDKLICHTFPTDDGGLDIKCPTEIAISDRREAELAKNGFIPLVYRKNSDFAAFIGAQSLQKPAEYMDADATANANLAARLPYLFACCRFAHYLKCIVRDKVGSFQSRDDIERWLNKWIINYVDGDPANSSQQTKARKPLAAAEVQVIEQEDNPGYYQAKFFLRPHYQLEGLTVSLRLVSKLPSLKQSGG
ncbi:MULTISPECIES: type VI secretion system contractile sheath large subunit [Photorhabdus]|uniref:Type VI secretion system contractile sheath large subunit n=1 Tax=Photorhabdus kayaii TaxID=230088 RepID=A0ABX0B5B2_9GAMM|nr:MULTISPECIES: type VI secretion system contractile sheath large subunit [Photorhabdus]MCC8373753.1 type VI secretion system contractile sheath large subunit [Photorhabdus bodei]MCT8353369.1 type VI secretion system contractile sheath large subunit [Photorhabdus kayaii]NDL13306.1 type VI secretion system contractile sheath large subunit [Photorhabdus kayaii]NDL26668.1 type VI secretion system contractile sheath large subunit [Photorhabdus kayaii]RAX07959.1 type VI secretion system contractil